ncbi:FtsK/SpoIIIE domain-containing protein [Rothia terrae]|uniref:FHA domain-containing protein n=1 Tax=Rothia terrae TaxID=396015 RepID=A0A7S7AZG0_9MICC|nr:FtsK/SpoIIIE domain-containing protein [Rothia terrae]QOW64675.1 FHA domain-containing protein [Rothia terrae]QOW64732.1 FHA domain-containing protein [Rothia terrae]
MRVLISIDSLNRTVEVDSWRGNTTLCELIATVGGPKLDAEDSLYIDTHVVKAGDFIEKLPLLEGSRISRFPLNGTPTLPGWVVSISGGLQSGEIKPVTRKRPMIFGRSDQADVVLSTESASWEHFTATLTDEGLQVTDSGSTNGTYVQGTKVESDTPVVISEPTEVQAGGATLLFQPMLHEFTAPAPGSLHNLTPNRTAPFNRPPRPSLPSLPGAVTPPKRENVKENSKFNIAMVLAPLVMAGAMVMLMGSFRYAAFALLSPVVMIATWFEGKHRYKKELAAEEERFAKALEDFKKDLEKAATIERSRRQELTPDNATVMRRSSLPSTELWQRRFESADFLLARIGTGNRDWKPELDKRSSTTLEDEVQKTYDAFELRGAPLMANLNRGGVVGIVGQREGSLALARSLVVQLATHVGPADLTFGIFCDEGKEHDWGWASWLPHTRQAGSVDGGRWMASGRHRSTEMLRSLHQGIDHFITPAVMLVLDSEVLTEGRDAPARELLGYGRETPTRSLGSSSQKADHTVSGIVIASSEEQLPASCTSIVRVREDAEADIFEPESRTLIKDAVLAGVDLEQAEQTAMRLAHFDDPELVVPGAALPRLVRAPELFDLAPAKSEKVQKLWRERTGISAPIGVGDDGEVVLDIVRDGPHGLVGGTTGSGKSEFLRTFVAGLAARNSPEDLNFILIDFKGGAAFKACERLPHTIGTISNLDEQLADRALRALDAEMHRRQVLFAQAGEGVDNIKDYMATNPAEPMPRILLVIDEFAMLAKDFPEVLQSLVNVAAVGRTLGVHMILATQRPAGVVNDDILANTNLRVALRVQSKEDSSNVIGVPDASAIERTQMGRAYVKLGQEDISAVQTALVTGQTPIEGATQLELRESSIFGVPQKSLVEKPKVISEENDLDLLIDAVCSAHDELGISAPRQVWPEALGERVALDGFSAPIVTDLGKIQQPVGSFNGNQLNFALADQPQYQRQIPAGWDVSRGNLMLVGIPGSGTTTALASLALVAAAQRSPAELDLLVLDVGAGGLKDLQMLPHTVAYVGHGGRAKEQRARFLRFLQTELERRRASAGDEKPMLILIDGLASLRDEFDDYDGQILLNMLYRAYAEGASLGMHFAVATPRSKAIPMAMDEVTTQKWLFKLADTYDYSGQGVKGKNIPASVAGRCVSVEQLLQMHVATPDIRFEEAVVKVQQLWPDAVTKADVIGQLPDAVTVSELGAHADLSGEPWRIPVGLGEQDLSPVFLETYHGEHILIAGTARSGKSTLLLAIRNMVEQAHTGEAGQTPEVWAICSRRSPLASEDFDHLAVGDDEVPALVAQLRLASGPVVLLIDDADSFADNDKSIAGLVDSPVPGLCIVAAGRSDELRTLYSHWTKTLRKAKCGVLLQPNVDLDGDLLGARIPRKAPVELSVGRGYAVSNGNVHLVQAVSAS